MTHVCHNLFIQKLNEITSAKPKETLSAYRDGLPTTWRDSATKDDCAWNTVAQLVPQQECVLHTKKEIKFWLRCKLDFQTWVILCGLKILKAIENTVNVNKIADSLSKFKTFFPCMVYHSAPICSCKIRIHKKWYSRVSITCQKHW